MKLCWIFTIELLVFFVAIPSELLGIHPGYSQFAVALKVFLIVGALENHPESLKRSSGPVLKTPWNIFKVKAGKDLAIYFIPLPAAIGPFLYIIHDWVLAEFVPCLQPSSATLDSDL